MRYKKPNLLLYRIAQFVCWVVAVVVFRRKILRNEIRHVKGPFVVIANHQAAYDFVDLMGLTYRPMSFVISSSFFNSLPINGFLRRIGVIPKQQFQTSATDMKNMKAVIDAGQPLAIYPAGLMCEDGVSTPIPAATYKFLKWLNVDVYMARVSGTYFAMPKWAKGLRSGRTYIDVYKLFSKEELAEMDLAAVRSRTDEALLFDAYREQEQLRVRYKKGDQIDGLENVLYQCPNCMTEFSMEVTGGNTLHCKNCGCTHISDEYGFLHHKDGPGEEFRYVSDWNRHINTQMEKRLLSGKEISLSAPTAIYMVDHKKHKFVEVGRGTVSCEQLKVTLDGQLNGEEFHLQIPTDGIPTFPFKPGKYFEVQHGKDIYRCALDDGRLAIKFINLIKSSYAVKNQLCGVQ